MSIIQPIPDVDFVIDGVYIGSSRAIQAVDDLRHANIRHILKLYYYEPYWPQDFVVFENPVIDGQLLPRFALERGVNFIKEQVALGNPVLVLCGAGISRASTFVLGYMLETGHELHAAFRLLRQQHSTTWPLPAMWLSLIEHYQLPYSPNEVLRWQGEQ